MDSSDSQDMTCSIGRFKKMMNEMKVGVLTLLISLRHFIKRLIKVEKRDD